MVLFRLHVWGPAFGLASIDAECLATITYLANALQGDLWELVEIVATSPSGVPTREFSWRFVVEQFHPAVEHTHTRPL